MLGVCNFLLNFIVNIYKWEKKIKQDAEFAFLVVSRFLIGNNVENLCIFVIIRCILRIFLSLHTSRTLYHLKILR